MPKLLLIDDHELVLDALSYILKDAGFEVLTSTTGRDGVRIAHEQKPDIIVTDYHMIGMTGMDVLKAVRNDPGIASIPVVILTLEDNKETKKRFFENGADAFLTKSQRADELVDAIKHLLYGVT